MRLTRRLGHGAYIGIPVAGSGRPGLQSSHAVTAYWAAVGVLNIQTMFAHNVREYTETRK